MFGVPSVRDTVFSGINIKFLGNGLFLLNGTSTATVWGDVYMWYTWDTPLIVGHRYYVKMTPYFSIPEGGTASSFRLVDSYSGRFGLSLTDTSLIFTNPSNNSNCYVSFRIDSGIALNNVTVHICMVDLNETFGDNNNLTKEQCDEIFNMP